MSIANVFGRPARPGTPQRGRYLVRNLAWNTWLRASDLWLERAAPMQRDQPLKAPRRVLLAVGGQLGDAVIATSVIAPLRSAVPDAEISVLCGSWSAPIFSTHPAITKVHTTDHWKLDRSGRLLPARWMVTRRSSAIATEEIRAAGYDVAIDLSAYYPNSARLLASAGVPVRVGFTSGGAGVLYTHPIAWTPGRHVAEDHLALLRTILPQISAATALRYDVPEPRADAVAGARGALAAANLTPGAYVAMHIGAGMPRKEWPLSKWRAVVAQLSARGVPVVLTGAGARQAAQTRALSQGVNGVADLCDRLGWDEFRWIVASARVLISVDTVAMHVAAAAGTPCVALMTAMDDPERWRPLGEHVTLLTTPVPCAPCYRSRGCVPMSCIREVTPAAVVAAASRYLNGAS